MRLDFSDFGQLDKPYCWLFWSGRNLPNLDEVEINPVFEPRRDSSLTWITSLPATTRGIKGMTPNEGNVLPYTFLRQSILPDPEETKQYFRRVYEHAVESINLLIAKGQRISFLAGSMGCWLPLKVTAENGYEPERIVLAFPGANMSRCINRGRATQPIVAQVRKNGDCPHERFRELSEFSPYRFIPKIPPDTRLEVSIAPYDYMVPYLDQKKFADYCLKHHENTQITLHKRRGHVTGFGRFAKTWQRSPH